MLAAIILGHSHMSAIIKALKLRVDTCSENETGIRYYLFNTPRLGLDYNFTVQNAAGKFVINPSISEIIKNSIPENQKKIYLTMFGGNAHNALTLLQHPRPFDFILPDSPGLRVPNSEVVPLGYIKRIIDRVAEKYIINMISVRESVSEDVFHFESPPPYGDTEYILHFLEAYFRYQDKNPIVAPRELRYKIWRLHSEIINSACKMNSITFVKSPSEAMDFEGYLVSEAYGEDSTHAGPWYGDIVLRKFEEQLGVCYSGWQWLD